MKLDEIRRILQLVNEISPPVAAREVVDGYLVALEPEWSLGSDFAPAPDSGLAADFVMKCLSYAQRETTGETLSVVVKALLNPIHRIGALSYEPENFSSAIVNLDDRNPAALMRETIAEGVSSAALTIVERGRANEGYNGKFVLYGAPLDKLYIYSSKLGFMPSTFRFLVRRFGNVADGVDSSWKKLHP